jgi:hypothetical protein
MTTNRILRITRRARQLAPNERRMAIEALTALAWARLLFLILPFPVAMARFGLRLKIGEQLTTQTILTTQTMTSASATAVTQAIARAIGRSSRVAPFRAVCLQQALAAAWMLRRRGLPVEVHFGVAKNTGKPLSAHAWSMCGDHLITGWRVMKEYTRVAIFTT